MAKQNIIIVKDANIRTMNIKGVDYICITDIARQKNAIDPNGVILTNSMLEKKLNKC